jgi:hypothetical protein
MFGCSAMISRPQIGTSPAQSYTVNREPEGRGDPGCRRFWLRDWIASLRSR